MKNLPMAALDSETVTVVKRKVKTKKKKVKTESKGNNKEVNLEVDNQVLPEKSLGKKRKSKENTSLKGKSETKDKKIQVLQKNENNSENVESMKIGNGHDIEEKVNEGKRSKEFESGHDFEVELPNKKQKSSFRKGNDVEKSGEVSTGTVLKKKKKKKNKNAEQNSELESIDKVIGQDANNTSSTDIAQKKIVGIKDKMNAKIIQATLNTKYKEEKLKTALKKSWSSNGYPLKIENTVEIIKKPFTCGHILDLLSNENILEGVKKEIEELEVLQKNNDLYKFKQTTDLKNASTPSLSALRNFLYGPFRKYLMNITGIELDNTVDMGSSLYEQTDVLLCHDDELEGRRIAYILYLVPPWDEKDGGTLDVFHTDKNGQPADIAKSFFPVWNSFAFFEVSPVSFHQVSEVLAKKKRLSINGWYHGSPVNRPPKFVELPRPVKSPCHIEQEDLYSWINHVYLDPWTQKEIKTKFQKDSQIELEQFLAEDKYEALLEAIKLKDLKWHYEGPANKRHYEVTKANKAGELVRECLKFLRSEAVFLIFSQLTGLRLHKLAPPDSEDEEEKSSEKEPSPCVSQEIRRVSHGSYTLVHDDDPVGSQYALDAMLFLGVSEKWTQALGGFTSYIARDEDEELLTVLPRSNSLSMVYRDKETLKFTKHVNTSVKDLLEEEQQFYEVNCTYYEGKN